MATKVKLRRKTITGDRESLFLEFYPPIRHPETMKMVYKEYLGIYIFKSQQNQIQKEYNDEMLIKAEGIWSMRVQAVINEEYGFLDKHKKKADFLEYFYSFAIKKDQKWLRVYSRFETFVNGKCQFGDVTVELCRKFRDYLLTTKQLRNSGKTIKRNSAAGYFSTFRALLKIAYRDKMIRENINDHLERIDWQDVKKEYLTLDELKLLAETPCEIPILKTASLFACLTGLRISDILALEWDNIEVASEGGYCMRIRTEKTETETTLPISTEALELCGERTEGKVFKGFERHMAQYPLKKWLKQAVITKSITFRGIHKHLTTHTARHIQNAYRLTAN